MNLLDCGAGTYFQFVSEWNIITSPTCLSVATIEKPPPINFLHPSTHCDWCESFTAVDGYGPGCLRDPESQLLSLSFFQGSYEGPSSESLTDFCVCMNWCGYLSNCVSVEIVLAYYWFDDVGTMFWYCNL